jgi:antitoxin HigA-1
MIENGEPTGELLPNPTPGHLLQTEFLEPLGITPQRLAEEIHLPQDQIDALLDGREPITVDMALRLTRFLRMTTRFWLGLQVNYDIDELRRAGVDVGMSHITPWPRPDLEGYEIPVGPERAQIGGEDTTPAAAEPLDL